MVGAEGELGGFFPVCQQALQFQHALARHDYLLGWQVCHVRFQIAHGEAMAIGSDGTYTFGREFEQETVQVIAHILLRHGEMGLLDELPQFLLGQVHAALGLNVFYRGEFCCRQGGQEEAAAA